MFIILGLWSMEWTRRRYLWSGVFFSLAAYAYPPMRVQALVLLAFLPGVDLKKKAKTFGIFLLTSIPLLLRSMDSDFLARSRLLALWSDYPGNPYHDASVFELLLGFLNQLRLHLTPDFLLFHGDHNLRHSIQTFGMLSWPELILCLIALIFSRKPLVVLALLGILTGIAPAALTWESIPHALRAIGAWPFFCVLAGLGAERLFEWSWPKNHRLLTSSVLTGACLLFSGFYLHDYFNEYPVRAYGWFTIDKTPLAEAYFKMTEGNQRCEDLRK